MNNHTRKTDDNKPITPDEWNNAINHLLTTIPLRFFRDVMILSKQEGSTWGLNRYHGLVMIIRNNLRKAGYNWGDIALDNYWQQLLEDAVTQVKSKIQYYEQHPEKAESHWKKPYQFPPEPPSYPMKYIIQIIITASREFEVYNYLKKQPEIIELHPLHGEFDLLAVFIDEDGTQLAPALDYFCTIPGIIRLVCLGPGPIIISRTLNNNTKKWKDKTTELE